MKHALLGGVSPREFLRTHWQRKPLLIRNAFPAHALPHTRDDILSLAQHEDCHGRLIWRQRQRWQLRHGPFTARDFKALGRSPWTVLVQDINHASAAADALLRPFNFIPYARLDDLMASYATVGGGVGPHVDSYDVFLLQGFGKRRWQISQQRDLTLVPEAPVKLLANFRPTEEWVLDPGDMLYLPPGVAHCGTAETECITYSIGFRAPSVAALQTAFVDFLADRFDDATLYSDPGLTLARSPGAVPPQLLAYCQQILRGVKWSKVDVAMFLGQYLTEPKATTLFAPPRPLLSSGRFAGEAQARGIGLHPKSRMLYLRDRIFLNGEAYQVARTPLWQRLANTREISAAGLGKLPSAEQARLYEWYTSGYLTLKN